MAVSTLFASGLFACILFRISVVLWALSHQNLLALKTPGFRDRLWWAPVLVFWGRVLPCWDRCKQWPQSPGVWDLVEAS